MSLHEHPHSLHKQCLIYQLFPPCVAKYVCKSLLIQKYCIEAANTAIWPDKSLYLSVSQLSQLKYELKRLNHFIQT